MSGLLGFDPYQRLADKGGEPAKAANTANAPGETFSSPSNFSSGAPPQTDLGAWCCYCGERVAWPNAEGVVFASSEGAHLGCYERHLCRHPSYWRARGLDAAEREAVADEGALDHGDLDPATIAEARALAAITRQAKECAEDPRWCDCGGRCCWGFGDGRDITRTEKGDL